MLEHYKGCDNCGGFHVAEFAGDCMSDPKRLRGEIMQAPDAENAAPVMGQHTPGPWETSTLISKDAGREDAQWIICLPDGGDMLADLTGCPDAEANANLMAAAPELLAALKDVLAEVAALDWVFERIIMQDGDDPCTSLDIALAAAKESIAKAEGR